MGKPRRMSVGGVVYHVLNRGNAKARVFDEEGDYWALLNLLAQAQEKIPMRILNYCVMPNHWHLVMWPSADGDLSRFMHWFTDSHVHRWQVVH